MAKLPSIKKLLKSDFPEAPAWFDKVIVPLNKFMEEIYYSLDKNLSVKDNLQMSINTINFKTKSTYVTDSWSYDNFVEYKFTNPLAIRPSCVLIGKIVKVGYTDNFGAGATGFISLDWTYLSGNIVIKYITGLEASTEYDINLLIL